MRHAKNRNLNRWCFRRLAIYWNWRRVLHSRREHCDDWYDHLYKTQIDSWYIYWMWNACSIYWCNEHRKYNWNEFVYMTRNLFAWCFVTTKYRQKIFNNNIFCFQRRYNLISASLKYVWIILIFHWIIFILYAKWYWLSQLHDRITSKKSFWCSWKRESNV